MFLLVSVRHVGAHPGEHQRGVSIQIVFYYKFGLNISSDILYTKYSSDLNLGEGLCICNLLSFPSLRASSPIWASEVSLARTRERGAEEGSLLSSAPCGFATRSRVVARLASLAQI